ncbi:hypothetical protein M0R01_03680 [bacterium]|nr:hypothetical protein [bacterium]
MTKKICCNFNELLDLALAHAPRRITSISNFSAISFIQKLIMWFNIGGYSYIRKGPCSLYSIMVSKEMFHILKEELLSLFINNDIKQSAHNSEEVLILGVRITPSQYL